MITNLELHEAPNSMYFVTFMLLGMVRNSSTIRASP